MLAKSFLPLALEREQDTVTRRLYEFVGGALHPALVPDLVAGASMVNAGYDLRQVLRKFTTNHQELLNFLIVQNRTGRRIPVRQNQDWGPLEGLQLALMSLSYPDKYGDRINQQLAKFYGWNPQIVTNISLLFRVGLQMEQIIDGYRQLSSSLGISFDLKKHFPILRDALLLASDAGDPKYQEFVAKLALDACWEKRANPTLIKFFSNSAQSAKFYRQEQLRVSEFFSQLDVVANVDDLGYALYLQQNLPPELAGALLYPSLSNALIKSNSFDRRVGYLFELFPELLMNPATFAETLAILTKRDDEYLVIFGEILMGQVKDRMSPKGTNFDYEGVVAQEGMYFGRQNFLEQIEQSARGDFSRQPEWMKGARLGSVAQLELQELWALKKVNFEMIQRTLQRFLRRQASLNDDNLFAIEILLNNPKLHSGEVYQLTTIIAQQPGFENVRARLVEKALAAEFWK